jgi:hypothetical protein
VVYFCGASKLSLSDTVLLQSRSIHPPEIRAGRSFRSVAASVFQLATIRARTIIVGSLSHPVKTWNLVAAAFFLIGAIAFGDEFKTIDGKEYKNVTVSRVEPDGIVLITSSGISKVYFTELPKPVQQRFHYDAVKAAAYSASFA